MNRCLLVIVTVLLCACTVWGQDGPVQVTVSLDDRLGPMEMDRFALGQGGLSEDPMWDSRIAEIRALRPRVIRLFIQEYFDLLPARGRYHFETLDRSIDTILRTGATPLMCICFKPAALFPKVDQDVVEPNDYGQWEELIFRLVRHYKDRNAGIRYWEVAYQMKEGGLDYSCYYHIRDYHVQFERFSPFMSPRGTAFMEGWWNRMPQFDGLFDFQDNVRPAYFAFKLLSRLTGDRLRLTSNGPGVHGFATRDDRYSAYQYNLLLWNFSGSAVNVEVDFRDIPGNMTAKPVILDALTPSNDEIARLRPEPSFEVKVDQPAIRTALEPYGIRFWSFEQRR